MPEHIGGLASLNLRNFFLRKTCSNLQRRYIYDSFGMSDNRKTSLRRIAKLVPTCNPILAEYIRAGRDIVKPTSISCNTNHHTGRRVLYYSTA